MAKDIHALLLKELGAYSDEDLLRAYHKAESSLEQIDVAIKILVLYEINSRHPRRFAKWQENPGTNISDYILK